MTSCLARPKFLGRCSPSLGPQGSADPLVKILHAPDIAQRTAVRTRWMTRSDTASGATAHSSGSQPRKVVSSFQQKNVSCDRFSAAVVSYGCSAVTAQAAVLMQGSGSARANNRPGALVPPSPPATAHPFAPISHAMPSERRSAGSLRGIPRADTVHRAPMPEGRACPGRFGLS